MCIISILKKGTKKDTEEVYNFISCGFSNNWQGSGYMYKRDKDTHITVNKGFFKLEELIESLKSQNLKDEDELIIHHRISTHGVIDEENCHPFVASTIHEEVVARKITIDKPCVVHNGVFKNINNFRENSNNFSDTYTFVRFYLGNSNIMNIFKENKLLFSKYFTDQIGNSKMAVLYPDRDLEIFGNFEESNGYLHSNKGYCEKTRDRGGNSYSGSDAYWQEYYDAIVEETKEKKEKQRKWLEDYKQKIGFLAKDSFRETINDTKIIPLKFDKIVLDSSYITINDRNYSHFIYVWKDQYARRDKLTFFTYILNSYDKDALNQILERTDIPENPKHYCITTGNLEKKFYFIPKSKEFEDVYKDYLKLITCKGAITKSTLTKLNTLINKTNRRGNFDRLMYHKLGEPVCKYSLLLYKAHLDSLNIGKSKSLRQAVLDGEVDLHY